MGLSNLTSSIRAKPGISLTGLDVVEASIGRFDNISSNSIAQNGILMIHDNNRNKQLSVGRNLLSFSIPHRKVNPIRWLKYNNTMNSNVSGFRFIRNATIVGITVQTNGVGTGSFEVIEKVNATSNIATTVTLTSESYKVIDNINIDINKNSIIEVKSVSGEFSYPTFTVEFAWRL
jgi:hypothetical protein